MDVTTPIGVAPAVALALASLVAAYAAFLFVRNNFLGGLVRDNEPPPPKGVWWFPVIGHLIFAAANNGVASMDRFHDLIRDWRKNGNVSPKAVQIEIAGSKIVGLSDLEDIKHMVQTNFNNYVVGQTRRDVTEDFLGRGIFTEDDGFWRTQRYLAKPAFENQRLEAMLPVFEEHAATVVKILAEAAQRKAPIEMENLFMRFTLDSSGQVLFGHSVGSLHRSIPFQKAFDYVQLAVERRVTNPLWKILPQPTFNRHLRVCNEFVADIIKTARTDPDLASRQDLLAHFMTDIDEETGQPRALDDKYLRDMLMNFLIAGRDTTATSLTWLFYEIARHPNVEAKILAEMDAVLGPDEVPRTGEEIRQLKYLHQAINETLRLWSVVPRLLRCARDDDILPSGYRIKAGAIERREPQTNVMYQIYMIHRDEQLWGDDALEYDPERWTDERTKNMAAYQFVPFHGGPRRCLGFQMAYNEITLAAATLLRRFHFELVPGHVVRAQSALTLGTVNGVLMNVTERVR